MRGTPHVHFLVCVSNEEDSITANYVSSDKDEHLQMVKDLIKQTVSATLMERVADDSQDLEGSDEDIKELRYNETLFDWNTRKDYFKDEVHPSRLPFPHNWDFGRDDDGKLRDDKVKSHYRRIQLANQMHSCCFTCWKYCSDCICRFGFPYIQGENNDTEDPYIQTDRDRKSRVRTRVNPPRNNANINVTYVDPLLTIAHGGNQDLQFILNLVGAAEYCGAYAAKVEAPDQERMTNLYNKKLSFLQQSGEGINDRQRLVAVANAIVGSTQVGSVQACYFLLGQPFVISSRRVINVNPLHREYYLIRSLVIFINNKIIIRILIELNIKIR
jgi:hypothetical protein